MKKILLSSLLAVMAVTSANAKIASTDYADEVAQVKANAAQAAAEAAAKSYTDGLTGDVSGSAYISTLDNGKQNLTGAVEALNTRIGELDGDYGSLGALAKKDKVEAGDIANSVVDSGNIIDGSIVNGDISDSANIAQSKIAGLTEMAEQVELNESNILTNKSGIDAMNSKASKIEDVDSTNINNAGTYVLTAKVVQGTDGALTVSGYVWEQIDRALANQ